MVFIGKAQNEEIELKKGFDIQISAIPGFASFDFGKLNNFLQNKGLPQTKEGLQFTPSFTIATSFDEVNVLNVTVGFNNAKGKENGNSLEQNIKYGEFGFDRYLFQKERSSLFLGIAYGSVWYDINIQNNSNAGSFSGALDEYGGSVRISSNNNQYIALKTGYDWAIDKNKELLIGARLGYRIGLGKEKWEIKNESYDDSPETSAKGLFFGISFSFNK